MYNTPFKLDDFEYLVIQPTKARPAVDLHMKYVGCGNEPAWVYKKLKDCQGGGIFAYNKKSPYMVKKQASSRCPQDILLLANLKCHFFKR